MITHAYGEYFSNLLLLDFECYKEWEIGIEL